MTVLSVTDSMICPVHPINFGPPSHARPLPPDTVETTDDPIVFRHAEFQWEFSTDPLHFPRHSAEHLPPWMQSSFFLQLFTTRSASAVICALLF